MALKTVFIAGLSAAVVALGVLVPATALAAEADTAPLENTLPLEKLRADYAMRYAEPSPHVALAKHHFDRGNRILAFFILEAARRRFTAGQNADDGPQAGPGTFHDAFDVAFLGAEPFDGGKEAEAALLKKLEADRNSVKTLKQLADVYISRSEWEKAKKCLGEVIRLEPNDYGHVEALAEVFRREENPDEAKKLVDAYVEKHPESIEGYQMKVDRLPKEDRAGAKKALEEAIAKYPREGTFHFNLGTIVQEEGNLKDAEEELVKAASLAKDNSHIQGWAGRFFLKVKKDGARALEYYLAAYFLDPDFYDSEFAESRIRGLVREPAEAEFQKLRKSDTPIEKILSNDNPVVAELGLEEIEKGWDPKHKAALMAALAHDDEALRWQAAEILMRKAGKWADADLKQLLRDPDLRRRSLAVYIAVRQWKEKSFDELKPMLKDPSQLIRFEAFSALAEEGGEAGRKLVLEQREQETHPYLKKVLEAIDKQGALESEKDDAGAEDKEEGEQ